MVSRHLPVGFSTGQIGEVELCSDDLLLQQFVEDLLDRLVGSKRKFGRTNVGCAFGTEKCDLWKRRHSHQHSCHN
ncbi:hypothetical protein F2P81_010890 [Scophthalmus maximus]|uniref:Uncharacterized protein n=1 Tax=Scophthalmus maximus TaxID=52904 RepID=A0A6A4SS42_SCOMX|nr:hypothetical protein F2P81_010890 [Scophthalmus maximus]